MIEGKKCVPAVGSRQKVALRILNGEKIFKSVICLTAWIVLAVVVGIFLTLVVRSYPSMKEFGLSYYLGTQWDVVRLKFCMVPFLAGTLITSLLALAISLPFSLAIAIFLGEYYPKGWLAGFLRTMIDLLAGVPSVIFGFWGIFVFVPMMQQVQMKFGVIPYGVGVLTASIILAVMIIPYTASLACEVIQLVPGDLKEAAYSLGATRYEVIRTVIVPYTWSGIIAGIMLSLGRALGETMAVTMVIGNANVLPKNLFGPANTMASIIANEFNEAVGDLHVSSLIQLALVLFVFTAIISYAGKIVIRKLTVGEQ